MICPNCSAQIDDNSLFCTRCGTRLAQSIPQTEPIPAREPVISQEPAAPQQVEKPKYVQISLDPEEDAEPKPAPVPQATPITEPIPQPVSQPVTEPIPQSAPSAPFTPAPTPCPVEQEPPREKIHLPKPKKLSPKMIGIAAAALILLVSLAVILGVVGGKADFIALKGDISPAYHAEDDVTYFICNGKLSDVSLEGNYAASSANMTGTVLAIEDEDDGLYVFDGKKLTAVAENVEHWVLSRDGNTICYLDEDGMLKLYIVKSDSAVTVTSEDVDRFVLSPGGNQVLYTTDPKDTLCFFDGKKSIELTDHTRPLGLSDGGKYIYYLNENNDALYVTNAKGDSSKLCSDVSSSVSFNYDATQILFNDGDKWYVSIKGGDKIKIYSKDSYSLSPLLPNTAASNVRIGDSSVLRPLKDFADHCYLDYSEDVVLYLDKKLERKTIAKKIEHVQLCADGVTLIYTNFDGDVMRLNIRKSDKSETLAEEVEYFQPTLDGKCLYYIDSEDTLWYTNGGKARKIADDVEGLVVSRDGYCYFLTDYSHDCGELFSSKNGGKRIKVATDVYDLALVGLDVFIARDYNEDADSFDLYRVDKGTKLVLILKGV